MFDLRKLLLLCVSGLFLIPLAAQRVYKNNSVLATGNWYKISVQEEGVYKMDVAFLNALGITGSIPSAQLRLFGNGGGMLPEANSAQPPDDLTENAIQVVDGGDGVLNGSDYVLFYARGPHQWTKDSVNKKFIHQQNIYSNKAYYFISVGGNGLRIPAQNPQGAGTLTVSSFNERYFHELDSVNFLSSGREWFGEEFSSAPGRSLSRSFSLPLADLQAQPAIIVTNAVARSVNAVSRFFVNVNGQQAQTLDVPPITTALYDVYAQHVQQTATVSLQQGTATIGFQYTPGSFNSQGWLNWFEFFPRRNLAMNAGKQLPFRDWNSVGSGNVNFNITNADGTMQVWEVTDPLRPIKMNTVLNNGQLSFTNDASRLREYICMANIYFTPAAEGKVGVQNLHATNPAGMLIVTYPNYLAQAQRLAQFHAQHDNITSVVVTTDQVFNEFSSGAPDPVAIRDFAKMYYDRYQQGWTQSGKYLLLFGKSSFDYKTRISNNTNYVPGYESPSSLDPLTTYTTDDFFGFLDDGEDINSAVIVNQLDLGVGRIPAKTTDEAKNFVDKLMAYHTPSAMGPWRNNINFVADDEDLNLHLQDAESLSATTSVVDPAFNQQKIYLDAFRQESASAGGRYPQANAMVNNNIYNGTLIWNYSGHGGAQRLAEEVILDQETVNNFSNADKLPLFITATCDFAPYDNPNANSLGENLLVRPKTGAIALMTTTRLVFAFSNRIMNDNYLKFALQPDASGRYKTLGEAVQSAKNYTYQISGDAINNRKFSLLGDPAMTLAYPAFKAKMTTVNGKDIINGTDTLSATELVTMEGVVEDNSGNLLSNFSGTAYLSLFDKVQSITTLANDPTSIATTFADQENILFKGKASVQNGKFSFRFRVPKDINYQYGNGKLSLYAQDGSRDAKGISTKVLIGGISTAVVSDNIGPDIKAFLNDEKFVNGSITNNLPVLLLKLADSSGINTGGSGVDHDIVATLDNDNRQYYVLNNFYESDLNNYQKGSVRFQLPELQPGRHSLKIKAWDAVNNSSEYLLEFTVINEDELKIDHVLNYPNPFTTHTNFWFEHNYPGQELYAKVEIFTVSGKLINNLTRTINTEGNRSIELEWDGKDAYGNKIGRGVYIYRLSVRTSNGKTADKWQRLVIL